MSSRTFRRLIVSVVLLLALDAALYIFSSVYTSAVTSLDRDMPNFAVVEVEAQAALSKHLKNSEQRVKLAAASARAHILNSATTVDPQGTPFFYAELIPGHVCPSLWHR